MQFTFVLAAKPALDRLQEDETQFFFTDATYKRWLLLMTRPGVVTGNDAILLKLLRKDTSSMIPHGFRVFGMDPEIRSHWLYEFLLHQPKSFVPFHGQVQTHPVVMDDRGYLYMYTPDHFVDHTGNFTVGIPAMFEEMKKSMGEPNMMLNDGATSSVVYDFDQDDTFGIEVHPSPGATFDRMAKLVSEFKIAYANATASEKHTLGL